MTDRLAVLLSIVALVLMPTSGVAETYRWIDEQGNVTYSDRPPQPKDNGAPALDAKPAPDARAPELKASDTKAPEPKPSAALPEMKTLELKTPESKGLTAPTQTPKRFEVKGAPPAGAMPRIGPTKIDDLLELAGVRVQLAGLLHRVASDLRPPPGQMSPADQAAIERVLAQSLRHETIYAAVRDAFRLQVDRPNLEAAAAWLRTPVARKIVGLEIASSEPGVEQKVADYAASLKANPPSARRLELLQRLDWVTGANETSADLVAAIARGLSSAVSAAGPQDSRLRPGQIEDRAAQVRARATETLREVRAMSMLYTYQTLQDEELSEYVRFSGTDAGRWFSISMHKALVGAVGRTVEQTATELVRAVPLERWARATTPARQAVK